MSTKSAHDAMLEQAYARALQGDQIAGRWVLMYLSNALRGTGNAVLSEAARRILGEILHAIVTGTDACDATFTRAGSGNPRWHRQLRNMQLVGAMNMHIKEGMSHRAAARALEETKRFTDDKGKPLKWKTINNIWHERKDDPQTYVAFVTR